MSQRTVNRRLSQRRARQLLRNSLQQSGFQHYCLQGLTNSLTKCQTLASVIGGLPKFSPTALEHHGSRLASGAGRQRRLDVYETGALMMYADAESAHFFLYGRQDGDDGRQSVLVLGHEPPDVFDVGALSGLVLDVVLYVLQPHVEDSQRPLDGVELRHRQHLDVRSGSGADRRTARRV